MSRTGHSFQSVLGLRIARAGNIQGFFQTRAAAVPEFAKTSHDNRKLHNAIPEKDSFILQLFDNERAYTTWRTCFARTLSVT